MLRITRLVLLSTALGCATWAADSAGPTTRPLDPAIRQWRPTRDGKALRLQDFCFFEYQGQTIIASMMKDFCSQGITFARSTDLLHWEALGTALPTRTPEDQSMVWAPHVVQSKGIYYMFYTGVTTPADGQWCQRILVASSATPDHPGSWKRSSRVQFVVGGKVQDWFRPSHPGSVWTNSSWADCRDPMVLQQDGTWLLFYTGRDQGSGICGVATAPSVLGPWTDRGGVLKVPNPTIPESCYVLAHPKGGFVMVFNHAAGGAGSTVARSPSLLPTNGLPRFTNLELLEPSTAPGLNGWAHEFLPRAGRNVFSAYLTGYFITFEDARFVKTRRGWTVGASSAE
jgi:hypothetical protein